MSKGRRLRASRDRQEIRVKRMAVRGAFWKRKLDGLKESYKRFEQVMQERVPSDTASLAADQRPCGGTTYCVTRNGTRASHTHVGCRGG